MAEERIIVEVDLGVEGEELVVFGCDKGVDLDQRGVGFDVGLVKAQKELDGVVNLRRFETQRKGQLARLPTAKADGRIDRLLEDGLGCFGGHLLDLHAAGLRGHEDQLACGAIENDAEIEFAVDGSALFDE